MHTTSFNLLAYLRQSTWMAGIVLFALLAGYLLIEPAISHSATDQLTITQSVTAEISFITPTADVTMDTAIPGITGGTANGSAQIRVLTNNATGYTMTIAASGTPAMQGNAQGGSIPNYTPGTANVPDFAHSVGVNTGEFAYTISASTTSDLAQKFLDNTTVCNAGAADTSGSASCWYNLSTSATSTINRTTATSASGATSTIYFRTQITASPSPAIPQDTYVATTTLTATTNP